MTRRSTTVAVLILAVVLLAVGVAGLFSLRSGLPAPEEIAAFQAPASTRVLDCKDRLIAEFFEERRRPVPLDSIPACLRDAVVAVEDRRFYSHWGIDLVRIPGIIWSFIRNRGQVRGTSTITQQLARSMFLTYRRSLDRKLKEMLLAVELERHYSKQEILEMYLNQIWFGGSIYGVQAAAERYFGKPVSRLTLAECTTLAAMLANPTAYSPYQHPDRLIARRNFFLGRLRDAHRITEEQFKAARAEPLVLRPGPENLNEAPYFVEEIRRDLIGRYGPDFVYRSGSTVFTTLDLDLQRAANKAVEEWTARLEKDYNLRHPKTWYDSARAVDSLIGPPDYLQAALVCLDARDGSVRAMVGGRNFAHSEYNRATQAKRQVGSAFKPFVYVAAVDNGLTAADIIADSAIELRIPGQPPYRPRNYDGKFLGPITVRRALALSRNLVAVRVIERIGPELAARYANLMGVNEKLMPVYSLALGSVEIPLIDMTAAFATLANGGTRVKPKMVRSIRNKNGLLLEENLPQTQPVLDPKTAYIVTNMLQSVVDEGTATVIRSLGFTGPAAGKTGTTDDYTDASYIGYTPTLSTGVWVGYDKKKTIFRGATGGTVAAPIWAEFMKQVPADSGPQSFAVPDSIVTAPICEQSGKLASPLCPRVRYEVFITGTEPTAPCPLHSPARHAPKPDSFKPAPGH
ncbi:MAG: PBP1A family penicillin-binding protein [candidate division WOR-3 bacterium]